MLKELFESIKNSNADYPSVLMSKDSWQKVIAEIELLQIENAELKAVDVKGIKA